MANDDNEETVAHAAEQLSATDAANFDRRLRASLRGVQPLRGCGEADISALGMRDRHLPDSEAFLRAAEASFAFLRARGFVVSASGRSGTSLSDAIVFEGRHVEVHVSLDRRDVCVGLAFAPAADPKRGGTGPRWVGLLEYAIQRGYRGGLQEFRQSEVAPWYERDLACYAEALKALAPDVVADTPGLFGTTAVP